jgi:hypothetical protein
MKTILFTFILLLLAGCSDVVTNKYETYDDALSNNLFQRGWLPEIIPKSSTNITTSNNLDLNTSVGEFYFDPQNSDSFILLLDKKEGSDNGYEKYVYQKRGTSWVFEVNMKNGHTKYVLE